MEPVNDTLVAFGGEIKSVEETADGWKFGGYLVVFNSHDVTPLRDKFLKSTDYDFTDGEERTLYYNHGLDPTFAKAKLGRAKMFLHDAGVWIEGEIKKRKDYLEKHVEQVARGMQMAVTAGNVKAPLFGLSSGAPAHLVEREPVNGGHAVKGWAIAEVSITPTPAEPLTSCLSLKSLQETEAAAGIENFDALLGEAFKAKGTGPGPNGEQGHWVTHAGRHLFIAEGSSVVSHVQDEPPANMGKKKGSSSRRLRYDEDGDTNTDEEQARYKARITKDKAKSIIQDAGIGIQSHVGSYLSTLHSHGVIHTEGELKEAIEKHKNGDAKFQKDLNDFHDFNNQYNSKRILTDSQRKNIVKRHGINPDSHIARHFEEAHDLGTINTAQELHAAILRHKKAHGYNANYARKCAEDFQGDEAFADALKSLGGVEWFDAPDEVKTDTPNLDTLEAGQLEGSRFVIHSQRIADALAEWSARTSHVEEIKSGRMFSGETIGHFKRSRSHLAEICDWMDGVLQRHAPNEEDDVDMPSVTPEAKAQAEAEAKCVTKEEINQSLAQFYAIVARSHGVPMA